jgi:hypothetical protein
MKQALKTAGMETLSSERQQFADQRQAGQCQINDV